MPCKKPGWKGQTSRGKKEFSQLFIFIFTFTTKGARTEMITEKTFRKERRRLQVKHLWMDIKISWNLLLNRVYTEAPTGMSREQLHDLLFNRAAKGNQRNPYEEKAYRGPDQRSPGEVGAKSMVDVVLQTPTCAAGPGHQWLHTCIPGQGWGCSRRDWYIHGLLCKAVANKGGHIPAQTATTLAWCERPAWAEMKKWTWRTSDHSHGWQGGHKVEEMIWEAWGRESFHPFCEDFHRLFSGFCVCWVGVVCLAVVLFCFLSRWKDSCKNRLQTSIQSKVIGILWKVGGNRRRRGKGSCCPAASGTSGWLLSELELLDCHNTYELTLIRIRLGKTWAAIWFSGGPCGTAGTSVQHNFRIKDRLRPDWLARIPVASKADLHWFAGRTCWIAATTTSIHSQVVTDPPILVALQRRQQSRKADLNFQNKWVSHGCKSPVIDAGT